MRKIDYLEWLNRSKVSIERSDTSVSVRIENFDSNDMPYETGLLLLFYIVDCCEQFEKGKAENARLKARIAELEGAS